MNTLQDIINEVMKIREAIDGVEVKGHQNRTLLSYAYSKCDELIRDLDETTRRILEQNQNENESINSLTEDGEGIGEQNTGSAG